MGCSSHTAGGGGGTKSHPQAPAWEHRSAAGTLQRHVPCKWADPLPEPGFGGGESGLGTSCSWLRAATHPNLASDKLSLSLRISPCLCSGLRGLLKVREPGLALLLLLELLNSCLISDLVITWTTTTPLPHSHTPCKPCFSDLLLMSV